MSGEEDDLTIVSSWALKAYGCFAAELEELQELKHKYEQKHQQVQHEAEARCRAEVDEQMQREYPNIFSLLTAAAATVTTTTMSSSRSAEPGRVSTPPVPAASTAGSAAKRPKSKQAQQQLHAEVAVVTAKRDTILQQHLQAAMAAQERQPAQQLAAHYIQELASIQKRMGQVLEREAQELQRFTSRPLGSYALGEVLTVPAVPKPLAAEPSAACGERCAADTLVKREAATGSDTAGRLSRTASERGSMRSLRQKKVVGKPLARGVSGVGSRFGGRKPGVAVEAGSDSARASAAASAAPPFLIDAHQFAVEYNEMLKKEYGFRPAMTNAFPTATDEAEAGMRADAVTSAAADTLPGITATAGTTLEEKLGTHELGLTSKRGVCSVRLPAAAAAAAGAPTQEAEGELPQHGWLPALRTAQQANMAATTSPRQGHNAIAGEKEAVADKSRAQFAHSSPPSLLQVPRSKKGAATKSKEGNAAIIKKPSSLLNSGFPTSSAHSTDPLEGIECFVKDSGVRLATCVGTPARQVFRFTNRNAYRTRLRLKMSSCSDLTYRCLQIAPSAGGCVDASTGSPMAAETPLNCGGYMEVEVVYCPRSIEPSKAQAQTTLEMGVAREMNDRTGEGATWRFLTIAVQGQVVLPKFEWWCRTSLVYASTEGSSPSVGATPASEVKAPALLDVSQTDLLSHDAIAACATRIDANAVNAGPTVTFGDVLILARSQHTLFLENVGSEALLDISCSSPQFGIARGASDKAAALPPGQGLPIHVTFCPLNEGVCEAALTVSVRATHSIVMKDGVAGVENPILAVHTLLLRGAGIVPRVSIASLGSQVVQTNAMPQWRLSKTRQAPLHTILRDTMPGMPTEVTVTVYNACAVPLAYHWRGDTNGDGSGGDEREADDTSTGSASPALSRVSPLVASSHIFPSSGTLVQRSSTTFTLSVTPASLQPLQTLFCLFLDGLPDPSAAENAEKLSLVDADVVEFYQRSRPVPVSLPHQCDAPASTAADAFVASFSSELGEMQVTYLDPIHAFARYQRRINTAAGTAKDKRNATPEPQRPPFSHLRNSVFVTSFLTYQQPTMPSLAIEPAIIEEQVECLLQCRNTRTATLHNHAPIPLHFIVDPTMQEFTASLQQQQSFLASFFPTATTDTAAARATFERWRAFFPSKDGIVVQCQPRKGTIPARGSVTVTVHFTLEACGPHFAVVPCWIPEVEQLRAMLVAGAAVTLTTAQDAHELPRGSLSAPAAAPIAATGANAAATTTAAVAVEVLRVIEEGGCYALNVAATGVGATVQASTDLLDFGLIELGQEAAASFTVTNPNAIPVVFDLCDPLMRHPPRFVFIPESFRLGAGNTVEVTVYRKAVSTEDAQTFFELTVRDGGASIAVETRATIQLPLLVVEQPIVDFGVVSESVWQTGSFTVSNCSAIDTTFSVAPATPLSPYMEVEHAKDFALRAGEQLTVPVRCRFRACRTSNSKNVAASKSITTIAPEATSPSPGKPKPTPQDCYSILLGVLSKRSRQALLVEVRCDAVEQLSVSVDAAVVPKSTEGAVATNDNNTGDLAAPLSSLPVLSTAAYVRAVLLNALSCALETRHPSVSNSKRGNSQSSGSKLAVSGGAAPPLVPYTAPVKLAAHMPDDVPLVRETVEVVLQNYTGCEATYAVAAQRYAPQPMERIGAQKILDDRKKKKAEATALNGTASGKDTASAAATAAHTSTEADEQGDGTVVTLPAFWTVAVNGGASRQQQQRQILEAAQKALGDGSGCATLLPSGIGELTAHGCVRLPVELYCALPGRYMEQLALRASSSLPWLHLPVEYEVYGKPIVLDATTSGLTKDAGRVGEDVLLMPPVIASLGTSRRTIRLVNRVARDMEVTVEGFPCALGMAVHAIDPDAPAEEVVLKLMSMTAADTQREGSRVGQVHALPMQLCIPAHARREVVLEFTPNAGLASTDSDEVTAVGKHTLAAESVAKAVSVTGASEDGTAAVVNPSRTSDSDDGEGDEADEAMLAPAEKWWQGSVCIHAVLAQTELNDAYLIDEFYTLHAAEYPTQRVARPFSAAHGNGNIVKATAAVGSSSSNSGLSVAQLTVQRPLRTRPNDRVVRRSRIVYPTKAEQHLLDRLAARQEKTASKMEVMSDEDEDGLEDMLGDPLPFSAASQPNKGGGGAVQSPDSVPSLELLRSEATERQALLDFMHTRRRSLEENAQKYFTSIELRLRARCGRPRLAIEPSGKCVHFPAVQPSGGGTPSTTSTFQAASSFSHSARTVRLTNRNSAPLRFALSFAAPPSQEDALDAPAPSELFSIERCSLWPSGCDTPTQVFVAPATPSASPAVMVDDAEVGSVTATLKHVYTLDSMDALDVVVESQTYSEAWRRYEARQLRAITSSTTAVAVEGLLHVRFLPMTSTSGTSTQPQQEVPCQALPLRVPIITPRVNCTPGVVWFRPGQQRHDGRPQVAYAQSFTLSNSCTVPVRFRIRPVTPSPDGSPHHSAREGREKGERMRTFEMQQREQFARLCRTASLPAAVSQALMTPNITTTHIGIAVTPAKCESLREKVKEVVRMPVTAPPAEGRPGLVYVDDPSQFSLSPMEGVLPAATLGGEPGELQVRVDFREVSNVRFESLFEVVVEGAAAVPPIYVVLRGDSRDTEL